MTDTGAKVVDPAEVTKTIEALTKRINDLEADNGGLRTEIFDLRTEVTLKSNEASSARGIVKPLNAQIKTLQEALAKSEPLKELARLRIEVSSLHRQNDGWQKQYAAHEAEIKDAHTARIAAAHKVELLESTVQQAWLARDAAKKHEAEALLALEGMKQQRDTEAAAVAKLASEAIAMRQTLTALNEQHRKGHPSPLQDCKLCRILWGKAT